MEKEDSSTQPIVTNECRPTPNSSLHSQLNDWSTTDVEPWAHTHSRKHSSRPGRRSKRPSVLAEELEALETRLACRDESEPEPENTVEKHLSILRKQARFKRREKDMGTSQLREDASVDPNEEKQSRKSSSNHPQDSSKMNSRDTSSLGTGSSDGADRLSSQASQALAKSKKLEDQINLQHLVELMRIFNEGDENGSDGLDIDEFRAAFGQILGKGKNEQQMAIMFMKIDTNCDGTVDWDEFCTYMLLEYQEKEEMAGQRLHMFPHPLRILASPTHEIVTKIVYLPSLNRHGHTNTSMSESATNLTSSDSAEKERSKDLNLNADGTSMDGRYLSVCKDGTLCLWKNNLTLQRSLMVNTDKPLTWVTDLVVLPNVNKMMLSFTDNALTTYDLATANVDRQVQIIALPACVMHMHYWFDPNHFNQAVLVMGDTNGGIIILEFTNITSHFLGCSLTHNDNHCMTFMELQHNKQDGLKVTYIPKVHNDWVSQVKYCPSISYIMSSSNDQNCSLHLNYLHGRKDASIFKVRKGVMCFDYCKEWNIIGTGGLDRAVRYWNPYVPGKPIAVLHGHSSAIMHIAINSPQRQVLSLSRDLELRVWSIQHQLCIQSCHRCQSLQPYPPTAFYLHPRTGNILVGTNQIVSLESSLNGDQCTGKSVGGGIISHEKQLCAALYNENFNQIVSGCHGSVVSVWDIDTGEKLIQFSNCHGPMEITAMAFDPTGRRLITGGRDGSLKIWNFNNGACLSVLESRYSVEVTCINFMNQRIVVGGWCRCLSVYGDTRDPDDIFPKYWANGVHKEDILCMASQEPNTLASASYDGDIVVWNLDAERAICKLNGSPYQKKATTKCSPSKMPEVDRKKEDILIKEETSVEKILFLRSREHSIHSSATLISCGSGGWVQFWNHYGSGLIGIFNIWDNSRHSLPETDRNLECVTAMKVDSKEVLLITGNSLGYAQIWNITKYCVDIPEAQRPIRTPPRLTNAWRAHLLSIVSIDLAEGKGLLITASTDRSVRMWAMNGRYIGTFGEKSLWSLTYPIRSVNLPRKAPPGINRAVSYKSLQTISGPTTSKWKLARNLFRLLRQSKRRQEAMRLFGVGLKEGEAGANQDILGKCYERKTRFREPISTHHIKQVDGKLVGIYGNLHCPDILDVEQCNCEMTDRMKTCERSSMESLQSLEAEELSSLKSVKQPYTERSLLHSPPNRKVTMIG